MNVGEANRVRACCDCGEPGALLWRTTKGENPGVVLATSREPRTAMGGGVRLVVTLTVVVDEPDAPVDEAPTWPSGDFAIGDDRSKP